MTLTEAERRYLEKLAQQTRGSRRKVRRAQLVLLAADGVSDEEICRRIGCALGTVRVWKRRFSRGRLAALRDMPRTCPRKA